MFTTLHPHLTGRMFAMAAIATAALSTAGFAQYAAPYTPGYAPAPAAAYQAPQPMTYQPVPTYPTQNTFQLQGPAPVAAQQFSDAQIDNLTARIALYPDPLLAAMLPATMFPDQITFARQWIAQNPAVNESDIQNLTLDPSVKTLMHYPEALNLLGGDTAWTQALNIAFHNQQTQVMNSIQLWRQRAQAAGSLQSTPQQQVYAAAGAIQIVPAAAQMVYVPVYDPAVVYTSRPGFNRAPAIRFDFGGRRDWLDHDFDWANHTIRGPVMAPPRPPVFRAQAPAGPAQGMPFGHPGYGRR